jgi:hypothetical protein
MSDEVVSKEELAVRRLLGFWIVVWLIGNPVVLIFWPHAYSLWLVSSFFVPLCFIFLAICVGMFVWVAAWAFGARTENTQERIARIEQEIEDMRV